MRHAGTKEGPAHVRPLLRFDAFALARRQRALACTLEAVHVETELHVEQIAQLRDELQVFFDSRAALPWCELRGDLFRDERVELRVLRFLQPVVLEQALELRIERTVVVDRIHIVSLCHPLDV
jgi:hypothetical protein